MYLLPTQTWAVDVDRLVSSDEMTEQIVGNIGTNREYTAVGITSAGSYHNSIAFCDPTMAPRIAAAPDLAAALESMIRWSEDFEHGDRSRATFQKPLIFENARASLKAFHGRDLPLFKAA